MSSVNQAGSGADPLPAAIDRHNRSLAEARGVADADGIRIAVNGFRSVQSITIADSCALSGNDLGARICDLIGLAQQRADATTEAIADDITSDPRVASAIETIRGSFHRLRPPSMAEREDDR